MNKKKIAFEALKSPTVRRLIFRALKNRRVQKMLAHQIQRQIERRFKH